MGRSGGGGGGNSGGGGFSGGGRGGGSFSGGGGHSGGRSGGPSGGFGGGFGGSFGGGRPHGGPRGGGFDGPHGGPHGPRGPRGPRFGFGPSVYVGPGVNAGGRGCGGCLGSLIGLVLVMALLVVLYGAMDTCSGRGDYGYGSSHSSSYAAVSSTVRTKLDSSAVSKTAYYTDEDGDWVHSASRIESGLSHFYDKTGVQPYVYILKNGSATSTSELESLAEKYYDQLFSDEGHFLLVFCDTGTGTFNAAYWYGTRARTVMDDEAIGVLKQELNDAYNNADSDEEVFSDAFQETADTIMQAADDEARSATTGKVILVAVGVAAAGGVAYFVVRSKKKADAERKERADQILNTPLEKFGDSSDPTSSKNVEDLASKYEDKSDDA